MPVYNVTVEDSSPMVSYSQGWTDSNASDPQRTSYSEGTFHVTNSPDTTATFSFFGSAIFLFGAMRPGHGPFNISLDGLDTSHSAAASGSASFQEPLFGKTDLSIGSHTLILTNTGTGSSVDVDFITFTTGDGNSSTPLTNFTMDDTSPSITYTPPELWSTSSSRAASFFNSSLHASHQKGTQAVIPFTGDAVSIFGATSEEDGMFSVKIDDRPAVSLNGTAPVFRPQTLLYWAGGLGTGQHSVILTNTDTDLNFDFDDIVTSTWTVLPDPVASPTQTHASTSKTPIIAGVISGTCVGVAWIVALFLLLRRRRKRRRHRETVDQNEAKPEPFILPPDPAVVEGTHRPGEYAFGGRSTSKVQPPQPEATTSAPASSATHQTHAPTTSADSRTHIMDPPSSSAALSSAHGGRDTAFSNAMASSSALRGSHFREAPSEPSESVSGPSNSQPSFSAAELSATRMVVPNRPQDWGPIPVSGEDNEPDGLPPDYEQATQPMPPVLTRGASSGSR